MLTKRQVILTKIEGAYNTDPVAAAATDAVRVENLSFSLEGARMHERAPLKPSLGLTPKIYGGTLGSLSFDVYLKGSGAAGTAPEIDPLLRACGLGVTNVPVTSDSYAPVSTGIESCWIEWYEDGLKHALGGCRGSFTCTLTAGEPGKLSFSMTGHYTKPVDMALPAPTYDSSVPASLLDLTAFAVDGYAASVAALSFDMGVTLATPPDLTAADGFGEIAIAGRGVTGSIDPLASLIATYDWVTKWQTDTPVVIDTGVVGPAAGNRWRIQFPTAQYTEIGHGDRDGLITREIGFAANENNGDDEISIVFT